MRQDEPGRPLVPQRVLVVVAHPDDAEYAVGGTVAAWTDAGSEVIYILGTDGGTGSQDPSATSEAVGAVRRAEQRAAAAIVGVGEVVFMGYPDAILEPSLDLRRDLVRVIRRYRPSAVVCQDPNTSWFGREYINHPDHRALGSACLAAVFPAVSTPLAFPELLGEGLPPHAVREVYLTMTATPDLWIDIEPTLDRKLAAWRENRSQIAVSGQVEEQIVREAVRAADGQPGLTYAEAFKYFKLR